MRGGGPLLPRPCPPQERRREEEGMARRSEGLRKTGRKGEREIAREEGMERGEGTKQNKSNDKLKGKRNQR